MDLHFTADEPTPDVMDAVDGCLAAAVPNGEYGPSGETTVADLLKTAGYRTGLFGKWGLGTEDTPGAPTRQGFDTFFGYLHQVHAHFFYPYWLSDNGKPFLLPQNEGGKRGAYAHDGRTCASRKSTTRVRSPASAVTGAIAIYGYDGLLYSVGFFVAWIADDNVEEGHNE